MSWRKLKTTVWILVRRRLQFPESSEMVLNQRELQFPKALKWPQVPYILTILPVSNIASTDIFQTLTRCNTKEMVP